MNIRINSAGKIILCAIAIAGVALVAVLMVARQSAGDSRWYSREMVDAGRPLFAAHCASCHGVFAQGADNWRQRGADGFFPPPPLDGSGHTWHHPLAFLRGTLARGGAAFGGQMPAFGEALSRAERDSVIAFIQNLWPEEIYQTWATRVERLDLK